MQELAYVYEGKAKNGFNPDESRKAILDTLNPISREDGSGTRTCFQDMEKSYSASGSGLSYRSDSKNPPIAATTDQMGDMVSSTTNGIGYMSLGSVPDSLCILSVSKTGSDAVDATKDTILDATYPFSRPFVLLRLKSKGLSDAERTFMEYILSPEGQDIIVNAGFEALRPDQIEEQLSLLG